MHLIGALLMIIILVPLLCLWYLGVATWVVIVEIGCIRSRLACLVAGHRYIRFDSSLARTGSFKRCERCGKEVANGY